MVVRKSDVDVEIIAVSSLHLKVRMIAVSNLHFKVRMTAVSSLHFNVRMRLCSKLSGTSLGYLSSIDVSMVRRLEQLKVVVIVLLT